MVISTNVDMASIQPNASNVNEENAADAVNLGDADNDDAAFEKYYSEVTICLCRITNFISYILFLGIDNHFSC